MFLAPFGMLISKWAALRAFIDAPGGVVFVLLVAFGSAVTVFFWAKWMGLLIARPNRGENIEARVPKEELAVLGLLAALVVGRLILFPWISRVPARAVRLHPLRPGGPVSASPTSQSCC